ncbi:hypothetical protein [Micrococcoides hystricis]|uniref:Tat pathway signal sequence domain protein n=1 Tax=Micrococcoides hystricis TaxID=1572761 RepID=A0ABV6P8L6_9MICC
MTISVSFRRSLAAGLAVLALASGSVVADASPAEAATKKCKVTMSNSKPRQYSNTYVKVSGVGSKAKVTTVAHYKTSKNRKRVTATSKGRANVKYNVSRATPNRKVPVTVTAVKGKTKWTCKTSFTPRKK